MQRASGSRLAWLAVSLLLGVSRSSSQAIGSVAIQDASVSGALEVSGARAVLTGASSVTARDHAAEVTLSRGGTVKICQTSGVKLSSGTSPTALGISSPKASPPLMVALDRGSIELKMQAVASDIILTPDLRFAISHNGPIDLRIRVTPNGDTCVEQRETHAPMLLITDSFGDSTYEIYGDQHVLFEHGNLREVVDHETSPCGCPEPPKTMSLAEAALRPPQDAKTAAAEQHPFPSAESTGLAPSAEVPQAPPGIVHAQVATTLSYEAGTPPQTAATSTAQQPTKPTPPQQPHGFAHAIGHFFRRVFGGGKEQ